MYNTQISLGGLVGNWNLGPSLPLVLSYSPLNGADLGFGLGFAPGLTVYDTDDALLVLSSGERYKVFESETDVVLQQQRLETVRVTRDEDGNFYKIVHKSGDVEILTGPQNAYSRKVPTALLTPAGRGLTLGWDFGGAQPRLQEIQDENDTLLTVDLSDDARHVMHVLPGCSEGYDVEFWFQNDQLWKVRHLGLGADEPLEWLLSYDPVGDQGEWGSWLTGVSRPGGMSETVSYTSDGHQFPQSCDLPPLPFVVRLEQDPGGGQPAIEATYTYTSNNFVGGFSGASCDAGSDNLYGVLAGYTYGSTESRACQGQTRTITRTYNSYHLLTDEMTAQNGSSRLVHTDYYAQIGQSFDEQPAQFQLPRQCTVTWTDPAGDSRREVTTTSFDEQGNPESRTDPDGCRTDWTFYPAGGGGSACPPDPNGFTRWLKNVTRTPPTTEFDAPALAVSYQYTLFTTPDPRVSTVVLKSTETRSAGTQELSEADFRYVTSGAEFGRLQTLTGREMLGGDGGNPSVTVESTHTFAFSTDGEALSQNHTVATGSGLTVTRSERRSRFTGRLWSATDAQGNGVTVAYDGLGRLRSRTVNPGTSYQAEETCTYELGGAAPFVVTSTSPMMSTDGDEPGCQLRTSLDGAGRPIQRERKAVDGDGGWYVVQRITYDEQGRTSSITDLDHLPDGSQGGTRTETLIYDDWGEVSAADSSDGSTHLTCTDPIALTSTAQLLGNGSPVTGTAVTTHNLRGEPVRVERFDLRGVSRGSRTLDRDGWGRVRRETDEVQNTTHYDYNPRGLLTLTTLPDGTGVSRTYDVSRGAGGLATEIAVGGLAAYGEQTFDQLGRLIGTSSGGRTWRYDYTRDSDVVPAVATLPDGQRRSYTVIPELGEALAQVQADSVTQYLTPHAVTGFLTEAREGEVTITRGYYPSGLPWTETITRSGQPDTTATWRFTLGGDEYSYTGVDGVTRQTTRDALGRFQEITDPDLQVSEPAYDAASRLIGWTVRDRRSGFTLTSALTLDDLGREVGRDLTCDPVDTGGTEVWKQTQEWQDNDLLRARKSYQGSALVRDETFSYDSRNRLTGYTCQGSLPPLDEHGRQIAAQTFSYDSYGSITGCQTQFSGGGADTATYHYGNAADPCQLTGISRSNPSTETDLVYDAAGRLTVDDAGRVLRYDPLGRLQSTDQAGTYGYDSLNRLLTQTTQDGRTSVLAYRGETLATVTEDGQAARLLHLGDVPVAQHRPGEQPPTRLLGVDRTQTVRLAASSAQRDPYAYTPYGQRPTQPELTDSILSFTGQRTDPVTGCYHLGNGTRTYNPVLMHFTTPDPLSPFGGGGINPYAYCAGDPINRIDPSGNLSWQAWLGIGLGVAGLALTVVTGGLAIAAAGGVFAALSAASTATLVVGALGVASDVTAIASGALEKASPEASSILGWISLGTGLPGLLEAGATLARTAGRLGERGPELAGEIERGDRVPDPAFSRYLRRTYPTIVEQPEGGPLIVQAPRRMQDEYSNIRGFRRMPLSQYRNAIWTTEFRVTATTVEDAARRAQGLADTEEIHILSGTHGERTGNRTAGHLDRRFLREDRATADAMNGERRGATVQVHNMRRMRPRQLEEILRRPNAEIIVGFCYSRNDRQIRQILGLEPTVSFTRTRTRWD
ncbi:hypothetical protein MXD63_32440 [Frankia sp. Cpl3]|nr:hypothetical protein [Frankia sp. Cpl3]